MHTEPNILTTLESAANQILAAVAPTTSRLVRVTVVIRDEAQTASTDGAVLIRMPTTFCNVKVADTVKVAVGLLVHEVGHFLQPLGEINAVEEKENIPHWLTNVVLDIQAESLLQSLVPTFKLPLAEVRRTVKRVQLDEYEADVRKATGFIAAAGALALWGRFAKPILSFYMDSLPQGVPDVKRAQQYVEALDSFRICPARLLPERLAWLIGNFPELRGANAPALPNGLEGLQGSASGSLGDALRQEAIRQAGGLCGGGENAEIIQQACRPERPVLEAVRLARTIRTRFLSESGAVEVMAAGRFDRRSAVRGEMPLRMRLPGRELPAPKLVLCLDASGSMGAPSLGSNGRTKWQVAQIAAQALSLSVQAAGGEVTGVVFADGAWMTPDGNADGFTLPQTTHKNTVGNGTSFGFLAELWRRYPTHQILVVTDGSGDPPDVILSADRARTGAILIPPGDADRAQPWSARQILLADLRHLAAVLAMLVPRAHLG